MTNAFLIVILIILSWCIKLFAAWVMFLFVTWLQAPLWMVIAMVAVAACEAKISKDHL